MLVYTSKISKCLINSIICNSLLKIKIKIIENCIFNFPPSDNSSENRQESPAVTTVGDFQVVVNNFVIFYIARLDIGEEEYRVIGVLVR